MDKKSQHVGNHGGRYTDIDGMSKQFTYIDHDKKTRISTFKDNSNQEEMDKQLKQWRDESIAEILALPPVNVAEDYAQFIIREREKGVIWDKDMVIEACLADSEFRRVLHMRLWRSTVKEKYWFEEMSHEDILAGKWKNWM